MSLYDALSKLNHFSEFADPLFKSGGGVLTPAQRKALALTNLGLTATAAEVNKLAGVTAGTVSASKALVADANKDIFGIRFRGTSYGALAAAGSAQGDAAAIVTQNVRVTGADDAVGVKLPTAVADMEIRIWNTVTDKKLLVYPATGAAIDALSADAALTMLPGEELVFIASSATQWFVKPGLRIARGQQTTVAAEDTIVTGLRTVTSVVAGYDTDPADANMFVSATIGDQAGTPAAGSIIIKTWKSADGTDPTPVAATSFSKKVNWIAIGV